MNPTRQPTRTSTGDKYDDLAAAIGTAMQEALRLMDAAPPGSQTWRRLAEIVNELADVEHKVPIVHFDGTVGNCGESRTGAALDGDE